MDNLWVFLFLTAAISLSGIMVPGPVLAATVAKGYRDQKAGLSIALGHGLVEFPLMVALYSGLKAIFTHHSLVVAIGIVGGLILVLMGYQTLQLRGDAGGIGGLPYNSLFAGALTTAANPYFFLWWATVGSALIAKAMGFNPWVVLLFSTVHWSCDLAWYLGVSMLVFRTKGLWSHRFHRLVLTGCGMAMIGFGGWFVFSPLFSS